MSSGAFLKVCSTEIQICSVETYHKYTKRSGEGSKCLERNTDIVLIACAAVMATLALLTAYGCIFAGTSNPMSLVVTFSMFSIILFCAGIIQMLNLRGCIVIKENNQQEQN